MYSLTAATPAPSKSDRRKIISEARGYEAGKCLRILAMVVSIAIRQTAVYDSRIQPSARRSPSRTHLSVAVTVYGAGKECCSNISQHCSSSHYTHCPCPSSSTSGNSLYRCIIPSRLPASPWPPLQSCGCNTTVNTHQPVHLILPHRQSQPSVAYGHTHRSHQRPCTLAPF